MTREEVDELMKPMTREQLENFAFSMVALAEKYAEAYKNRTISDIIAKDMFRAALNGDN